MNEKIILDTDIGSDIDDALCLTYLLAQPKCELLGITTVSGEVQKRAELASAICKKANKEIPIYLGIEKPLIGNQRQPFAPQYEKINNWDHEKTFPNHEAIEFMRKAIHANPGEITLLAVGPMTNIAVLFSIDEEIPKLLKNLVLMCGRFTNTIPQAPIAEWNAMCDPYAAAIVYNSNAKNIRSIGLDVTLQLVMSKEEVQQRFKSELLKPALDFAGVWFEAGREIVFHDPLAAASIFDNNICRYKHGDVNVELMDKDSMGNTKFEVNNGGKNEVATEVDKIRFFNQYFEIIDNF